MVVTLSRLRKHIVIFGSFMLAINICNYVFNISWQPNQGLVYRFEPTVSTLLLVRSGVSETDDRLVSVAGTDEEARPGNLSSCVLGYKCKAFTNHTRKLRRGKITLEVISTEHPDVEFGGAWKPADCQSKWRIALIIPIRDREQHLKTFVRNIIPFLKNQKAEFTIFAVEQLGDEYFNKAQTMDAGFVEAQKLGLFDCFIFHDVDMVPINRCNVYRCDKKAVRHLGISRNLSSPHMVWHACIGGVSAFTRPQFERINGFTTVMFGWGGEDDDAYLRIKKENIKLFRYQPVVGNYFSLPHKQFGKSFPKINKKSEFLTQWPYRKYDGLNTLTYKVVKVIREAMFTRIQIHIPGPTSIDQIKRFLTDKQKLFQEMLCRDTNMTSCASTNNTNVSNVDQHRMI